MQFTILYADSDGITHFSDSEIPLRDSGEIGNLSELHDGHGIIFRKTDDRYDYDWHPAPRRQWLILLDGEIEIETGDGEIRRFRGGDILRLEDVNDTRGHRTRQRSPGTRRSIFIPF